MAKIAVAGTGYVGLVSGACLADFGNDVICVDNNYEKIALLKDKKIPIYEPGLKQIVKKNVKAGRLKFTTNMASAVKKSDVIFIAVGTPPLEDGSVDLSYVEAVAREIAKSINSYKVIVDKSTVPIGTAKKVTQWVQDELKNREDGITPKFEVVSNPEFLREGSAVQDFTHPDRVVIGAESPRALEIMKEVYRALYLNETPYIETNLETAEMIKYAANSFLAVKISYINEIANLCEKIGANVQEVAKAIGRDPRIGEKFLHPGPGYGGSCFPKDTKALVSIAKTFNTNTSIVEAAIKANDNQKMMMVDKILKAMGNEIKGKTITLLGLAFKQNTDDIRESSALTIIPELIKRGAKINATDPEAISEAKKYFGKNNNNIKYFKNEYKAMQSSDCLVLITEWNRYRTLNLEKVKTLLNQPIFCDLRNIYNRKSMENLGFIYIGVGT